MARSSGTRHGNGMGWGGAPKGETKLRTAGRFQPGNQGNPTPIAERDFSKADRKEKLDDRLFRIAMGEDEATNVNVSAAVALLHRIDPVATKSDISVTQSLSAEQREAALANVKKRVRPD